MQKIILKIIGKKLRKILLYVILGNKFLVRVIKLRVLLKIWINNMMISRIRLINCYKLVLGKISINIVKKLCNMY